MGVRRLHELLQRQALDEVISLGEVQALIAEASSDQILTPAERMTLEAALETHRDRFTPEAWLALVSYLRPPSR